MKEPKDQEPKSKEKEVVSAIHSGNDNNDVELAENAK